MKPQRSELSILSIACGFLGWRTWVQITSGRERTDTSFPAYLVRFLTTEMLDETLHLHISCQSVFLFPLFCHFCFYIQLLERKHFLFSIEFFLLAKSNFSFVQVSKKTRKQVFTILFQFSSQSENIAPHPNHTANLNKQKQRATEGHGHSHLLLVGHCFSIFCRLWATAQRCRRNPGACHSYIRHLL